MKKVVFVFALLLAFASVALAEDGFLTHEEITITFPYGDRTGYYTGSTVDGLPDGYGVFETQNEEGYRWVYIGDFEDGIFSGWGETFWEAGSDRELGIYENGLMQEGSSRGASVDWTITGLFGNGERQTFTGKLYNANGQLIFDGRVEDGIFIEGTLYNDIDGSVVAEGTFGEGFKNFIQTHYVSGYLY